MHLTRFPDDSTRACSFTLKPSVQHWTNTEGDGGDVDCRSSHQKGRRGLVATDVQHNPIDGIAEEAFHEAEVSEIAVQRCGRPFAGFLNGVDRDFHDHAASRGDPIANTPREVDVVTIAGRKIRPCLGNPDDWLT